MLTLDKPTRRRGLLSSNGRLSVEQCRELGRRVEVMLMRGNFEGARTVIDTAEKSSSNDFGLDTPLASTELVSCDLPAADLQQNQRLLNYLDEAGIVTVRDLLNTSPAAILKIPNVGELGLRKLVALGVLFRERLAAR